MTERGRVQLILIATGVLGWGCANRQAVETISNPPPTSNLNSEQMPKLVQENQIAFREQPTGSFDSDSFERWSLSGSWAWNVEDASWGSIRFALQDGKLQATSELLGELTGGQHESYEVLVLVGEHEMYGSMHYLNLERSEDGTLTGFFESVGGVDEGPQPTVLRRED